MQRRDDSVLRHNDRARELAEVLVQGDGGADLQLVDHDLVRAIGDAAD